MQGQRDACTATPSSNTNHILWKNSRKGKSDRFGLFLLENAGFGVEHSQSQSKGTLGHRKASERNSALHQPFLDTFLQKLSPAMSNDGQISVVQQLVRTWAMVFELCLIPYLSKSVREGFLGSLWSQCSWAIWSSSMAAPSHSQRSTSRAL